MMCIKSLRANLQVSNKNKRNLPVLKKEKETRPAPVDDQGSELSQLVQKLADPIAQSIDESEDIASVCGGATVGLVLCAVFAVNPVIGFFAGGLGGLFVRQSYVSLTELNELREECEQWLERYKELGEQEKVKKLEILVDDIKKVSKISRKEVKQRLKEIRNIED